MNTAVNILVGASILFGGGSLLWVVGGPTAKLMDKMFDIHRHDDEVLFGERAFGAFAAGVMGCVAGAVILGAYCLGAAVRGHP